MLSFCLSADLPLSRFDPSTLSAQASMELLVEGLGTMTKKHFQEENGEYKDLAEWKGVTLRTDGDVYKISWNAWSGIPVEAMRGTFDFRYLPRTLFELCLEGVKCQCTLDFAALPDQVTSLRLSYCYFTGSVDLAAFPASITEIEIQGDPWGQGPGLTGSVDLTRLPPRLKVLNIRDTQISGTINLEHLNPTLEKLRLNDNNFSGSVTFNNLPATLRDIQLSNNVFCGEIDLSGVPTTLEELNITGNDFSGTLDLSKVPFTLRVMHMENLFWSKGANNSKLTIIDREID